MIYRKYIKRALDVLLALLCCPFLLVILLIFSPIIYFSDKGPVFYNAPRTGKDGKVFKMYKLRSMYVNAPDIRNEDGSTFNAVNDPRVTPVGHFLRKTSLDEAPQILNVLLGDMSVIGPRPILANRSYKEFDDIQKRRLRVRPGITGYTQAYYRNSISQDEKFFKDVEYVDHISFVLDTKVLIKTVEVVLAQKNVYVQSQDCAIEKEPKISVK